MPPMADRPSFNLKRPAPGIVMCCICFEYRTEPELAVGEDGTIWDVCKGDCAEASGLVERGASDGH
jgi:hypothetical protein